ncbi:MAG: tyrosine-type recombinase/integrase [Thermogemmatispora sp.]|uniref:tyrosine-type recombinase/integrase n=1 Tax=Thermogemmatispora sp. TaxID=1968838 RepID=UPI0026057973|nr:tyrosine-type recombinase/integrase [Thermogemmatispora sp.]MBX5459164.1 tyrosine-type recombinase/integrase [Thermogemmatispora sp.]
MPTHRKSLIREAVERLDRLMAIGESRLSAKQTARQQGQPDWTCSTGRIHSYKTRSVYQEQLIRFLKWTRATSGLRRLAEVEAHAEELATAYLQHGMQAGWSAWTLATTRSALRLFFGDRALAAAVTLPPRRREDIRRSRGPVAQDRELNPDHWQGLIDFLRATGLRRREVAALRVGDLNEAAGVVLVRRGKGGRRRLVPVLPGVEELLQQLQAGREPEERIFARVPSHLDVHALRREYAQALYRLLSGGALPPATGRLRPADYDRVAVEQVAVALGHNRVDVVLRHYLR